MDGTIEMESEAAATSALKQREWKLFLWRLSAGLELIWLNINKKKPKVSTKDIVVFSRQFSTMINAGLPILQGLTIVAEQAENKDFRVLMAKEFATIFRMGSLCRKRISRHPKVFSTLYVNMVKAGEQGGILDIIFERLSEYMEKGGRCNPKSKISHDVSNGGYVNSVFGCYFSYD
jgi:type IV pilus assembly protein PilC